MYIFTIAIRIVVMWRGYHIRIPSHPDLLNKNLFSQIKVLWVAVVAAVFCRASGEEDALAEKHHMTLQNVKGSHATEIFHVLSDNNVEYPDIAYFDVDARYYPDTSDPEYQERLLRAQQKFIDNNELGLNVSSPDVQFINIRRSDFCWSTFNEGETFCAFDKAVRYFY